MEAFDSPLRGELSSLRIVPRVPLRFTLGYFRDIPPGCAPTAGGLIPPGCAPTAGHLILS